MTYKLLIYEWIDPPAPSNRFRVVETYNCIDGWRTRITDHSFPTLEEAKAFITKVTEHKAQIFQPPQEQA